MTLPRAIEVQRELFEVLFAALEPIPVSSTPLGIDRYVRVDGLVIVNQPTYRNYEKADHRFLVHAFDSPSQGASSFEWAISTLMQADSALRQITLSGASRVQMEDLQVSFEPRSDGKLNAHAFARYNVTIGDL